MKELITYYETIQNPSSPKSLFIFLFCQLDGSPGIFTDFNWSNRNAVTLTSVLSACDKGAQWPKAMALLGEVLRFTPMPGQQVRDRWKSTRNGGVFKAKHNK